MEREIGEIFEFETNLKLQCVADNTVRCSNCHLYKSTKEMLCRFTLIRDKVGPCNSWKRSDKTNVKFIKID
jgi:hypothetical protein